MGVNYINIFLFRNFKYSNLHPIFIVLCELFGLIKNNKVPVSLLSLGDRSSSKHIIIPIWYGIIVGIIMLLFGIYRLIKNIKATSKTF